MTTINMKVTWQLTTWKWLKVLFPLGCRGKNEQKSDWWCVSLKIRGVMCTRESERLKWNIEVSTWRDLFFRVRDIHALYLILISWRVPLSSDHFVRHFALRWTPATIPCQDGRMWRKLDKNFYCDLLLPEPLFPVLRKGDNNDDYHAQLGPCVSITNPFFLCLRKLKLVLNGECLCHREREKNRQQERPQGDNNGEEKIKYVCFVSSMLVLLKTSFYVY